MKISELRAHLTLLEVAHGDVEVYTEDGCGCCIWSREVDPEFRTEDPFEYRENSAGVYL